LFDFIAIPASTGVTLDVGDVGVTVALEGTADGEPLVTRGYLFPVEVCDGCLRNVLGDCSSVTPPFNEPCLIGQDEPVDCCTETGGEIRCPP
jgi:hypothetical protein